MYVRFQFAAGVFAEQVRDKLARSDVGCIPPTTTGFLVTHIAFPPAGPLPLDVGPSDPVQVRVAGAPPVTAPRNKLLLTLPVELTVRPVAGPAPGDPLVIILNFQLSVDMVRTAKGDGISVAYHGLVHREGTDPGIEKLVEGELSGAMPARPPVPFDYTAKVFDALASMTSAGSGPPPPPPMVSWSGMTLSPDRQTVEFRLELSTTTPDGTRTPWDWQAFHRREIDDLRAGRAWAVAIPSESLLAAVRESATKEIAGQGDINIESGPHVSWRPELPGFRITFSGELLDACTCLFDDPFDDDFEVDLDIDVTLDMALSLRATGSQATLQIDSRTSVDASDIESACCAVTSAALWPALGFKYLADGNVDGWGLVLGLVGGPIGAVLTMAFLFDGRPNAAAKDRCVTDADDEDHQICSYVLNLNPPPNPCDQVASDIWLQDVRGRPDALVLAGSLHQRRLTPPGVAADAPTPFVWEPPAFRCSGQLGDWSARSSFTVSQVGGEFPLIIGGVAPVGPAAPIYKPSVAGGSKCPTTAQIDVKTLPWTPGNPNPTLMAVLTNVGAFLVPVPPLPPLDPGRVEQRAREFPLWKVSNCYIFQDDWWARGLNPRWLPDPPPDEYVNRHLWVLEYAGLPEDEVLVVREGDADGDILAAGISRRGGAATLAFVSDADEVFIGRDRSRASGSEPPRYGIVISQLLLQQVDQRPLDRPATALRSVGTLSRPTVEVDDRGSSATFAVDTAGFLMSGEEPGGRLTVGAGRDPAADPARSTGRSGAPAGGAARDGLVRAAVAAAPALGLRSTPGADAAVTATQRPSRWLVAAGDEGYVEVDARSGAATAAYRGRPWADGMVRLGRTFVRLDDDARTLRTYRVAATVRR